MYVTGVIYVAQYSPPRRGGVARQPAGRSAGVARSASPAGRSLNWSSAKMFSRASIEASPYWARASRHPRLRLRFASAHPLLHCEEVNALGSNTPEVLFA